MPKRRTAEDRLEDGLRAKCFLLWLSSRKPDHVSHPTDPPTESCQVESTIRRTSSGGYLWR